MKILDRQKLDPMALKHVDEHPAVADVLRRLDDARRKHERTKRESTESRLAYAAVQDAVASGDRDHGQLRQALQKAEGLAHDLNIATRAVELAEQRLFEARQQAVAEIGAAFRDVHTNAVREFDAAMQQAAMKNARVEAIEDHAERLLPDGHHPTISEAQFLARPPRVAWRQVFEPEGRYQAWRKGCGVALK